MLFGLGLKEHFPMTLKRRNGWYTLCKLREPRVEKTLRPFERGIHVTNSYDGTKQACHGFLLQQYSVANGTE